MNPVKKVTGIFKSVKTYWREPPKGRYMPYREIASLATGGIGVRLVVTCITQMTISVGNTLIGNTIGIDPTSLYCIYILGLLSSFPLTALRAKMIDNTRSMKGKYRPYLISMGIPTTILGVGFIVMPYESMSLFAKCAAVLAFNIGFQFFYNFYLDSYESLVNVLSPNSIERSDVLSVRSVVENLSPSIYNIIFPLLAKLITGENTLYDLKVYRILFPGMMVAGFLISLLVYVNTREKIVQSKNHFIAVRFSDAFRAVVHNKYFWIISLAGWIGFLEGAFGNILQWMYNYQQACSAGQYSVITAIAGNASFWPNLVAPFLIRRFGKKKILIWSNLFNIGLIAVMLPVVRQTGRPGIIWWLLGCSFVNQFITSLGHLLTPGVNADIRDYQQFITGERIDGMFAAVGLIGNVITMVTGLVLPKIYEMSGLNKETAVALGYSADNVYDVLYNREYFISIGSVLVVAAVIGAALNVIPYFFYDYTEAKQQGTVAVLKLRAAMEDGEGGTLPAEKAEELQALLAEAGEFGSRTPVAIMRTDSKQIKKQKREENGKIEIARYVLEELNCFEGAVGSETLAWAGRIVQAGPQGFLNESAATKAEAKAMQKGTESERNARRSALMRAAAFADAKRVTARYFADGVEPFDKGIFEKLFAAEDDADRTLAEAAAQMKAAKENGRADLMAELRSRMEAAKHQKTQVQKEIKTATKNYSLYHRAVKPYLDAEIMLKQAAFYRDLKTKNGLDSVEGAK